MGNIIVSNDFITVASAGITVQSTAAGFDKSNVFNYANLKRRWRMDSDDKSATNPIMSFDLGAASTVVAVALDDINFNRVIIKGHASDLTTDWTSATFSQTFASSFFAADSHTGRYKAYLNLNSFNYRYMALILDTSTGKVGSYQTKWEIGRVGILDSVYTFQKNMGRKYRRGAVQPFTEIVLKNGHRERNADGDIQWIGTLDFDSRPLSDEVDLTTLNNYDISETLLFYENGGDYSKVYFCLRENNYIGTFEADGVLSGASIQLRERV